MTAYLFLLAQLQAITNEWMMERHTEKKQLFLVPK